MPPGPAFTRLDNERAPPPAAGARRAPVHRARLRRGLDGAHQRSEAGGISKALLYHYFPSKRAYFVATLSERAPRRCASAIEPDPSLPLGAALAQALRRRRLGRGPGRGGYAKLIRAARVRCRRIRALASSRVRAATAERILGRPRAHGGPAGAQAVVRGWLWFADGACLDWIEHRDLDADELSELLLGTLRGALAAAGGGAPLGL